MKRFRILFVAIMAVCLIGCKGRPKNMDERTYNLGVKALEIMDAYNNMEISEEEAHDQLYEIHDRLKSFEYSKEELYTSIQNEAVYVDVFSYIIDMSADKDLFKSADKLRKTLNK